MRSRAIAIGVCAVALFGGCGGGAEDADVGASLTSDSTVTTDSTGTTDSTATSDSTGTTDTTGTALAEGNVIEVVFAGGAVEGGVRREKVALDERVVLRVTSDVADEVHVHGYDRRAAVAPGAPTDLVFDATIPGVFEVELEERHREILKLEVGG